MQHDKQEEQKDGNTKNDTSFRLTHSLAQAWQGSSELILYLKEETLKEEYQTNNSTTKNNNMKILA